MRVNVNHKSKIGRQVPADLPPRLARVVRLVHTAVVAEQEVINRIGSKMVTVLEKYANANGYRNGDGYAD